MCWHRRQRGEIPIGCFIGLIVLALAVMVGIKTVPVMTRMGELDKTITTMADRANVRGYTDERIERTILEKAQEVGIDLPPEQVKVERTSHRIRVQVEYSVDLDFPFYTYHWEKNLNEERPLF